MAGSFVELYRSSVLCDLLQETLEELHEEGKVSQDLGNKVLESFDKSCLEALTKRAEAKGALSVRSLRPLI
jgi:Transcription initiation factor IIA, gamma subunit, helical domain